MYIFFLCEPAESYFLNRQQNKPTQRKKLNHTRLILSLQFSHITFLLSININMIRIHINIFNWCDFVS